MIRQPENFPETVKEVRRLLALSQEELAHALGVSFATVNRWENGKTVPSKLAQRQFEQFCKQKRKDGFLVEGKEL
ncbi:MAG: helix-turn-helix transcriptional regulator [Acidobacteria bacterium]|jgi:DNA-binding transcriptional regulator YiaG|nr:helix-turn-helix transcriptional regulator [Acidobacteriota bacterium]